jgi:hypothetical protein
MRSCKGFQAEAACHRGVLDCLHVDGVRSQSALQLSDNEAAVGIDAKDVETLALGIAINDPGGILNRDDHHGRAEYLRVSDNPLLKMATLQ